MTNGIIGAICAPVPWWKRWHWKLFPPRKESWVAGGQAFLDQVGDAINAQPIKYPKYLWWRGYNVRIDAPGVVYMGTEQDQWKPIEDDLRAEFIAALEAD